MGRRGGRISHHLPDAGPVSLASALSHWLTSLIAVLDAAALHLALAPTHEPKLTARLALRMGFVALA